MNFNYQTSLLFKESLPTSTDAVLGPIIDRGIGFVYQAMLDNRIDIPLENNNVVKTGYLRVESKHSDKQGEDYEDRFILFYNNNNFSVPSPTLVRDSVKILEFDIYRLYIYGIATEIAMNLRIANAGGAEPINDFFSEKIAEIIKGILVIKHHGPRVLPPSGNNKEERQSGTTQIWGCLEGYDHILIDGGEENSEILMYINTKLSNFTAYDKVAYDLATVNIPGARVNVAINVVKVDGKTPDGQSQNQGDATHPHDHDHSHPHDHSH